MASLLILSFSVAITNLSKETPNYNFQVVQEALDAAKAGRTCVMIAHRLSTVRDADVICVIHDGLVAETGTHTELIERKGLYYNLNRRGYA